jgi:hypothetical protein
MVVTASQLPAVPLRLEESERERERARELYSNVLNPSTVQMSLEGPKRPLN